MEIWRDRLILYDSGDLIDDYAVDPDLRNDLSALFLVRARPPVIERLELLPVAIDAMRVRLAAGEGRGWITRRLLALSAELGTTLALGPQALALSLSTAAEGEASSGRRDRNSARPGRCLSGVAVRVGTYAQTAHS